MAQQTKLAQVLNGLVQNVTLTGDELVLGTVRLGGLAGTELTKTILDKLVNLQNGTDFSDGTNSHTHDGRYFTESELGSSSASSGSDLIGDDDTYSNFTPAAATVKGALAGIDSALATAGAGTVKISSNDTTAGYLEDKIVSGNSLLTVSTLNDGSNEDLQLTVNQGSIDHGSIAGLADDDHTQYILVAGTRAFSGNQAMGGFKLTGLAAGSANGDSVRYEQLTALEALIQNFEWQDSALDYIADNTVVPPTEVSGNRYILSHDGGAPHANWDGASAGDIVEFNGSIWVATSPSTGMMISVDDESSSLRQWSGSAWVQKYFEATTASTGLTKVGFDIRLDSSSAGAGLGFSSGVLSVNVDDSTIEINSDTLRVKDAGISAAKLAANSVETAKIANDAVDKDKIAADVAGAALGQNVDGSLEVKVDDSTIEINSDAIRVKDLGISTDKLAATSVTAAKLGSDVAGSGLSGGNGSALAVSHSPAMKKSMVAGESFAANTSFLVRFAVDGETAGRMYKAEKAAAAADGKFYAVGIIMSTSALSAADATVVSLMGSHALGSSDAAFNAADIGKPVYLGASGAFSVTPSSTTGDAVYRIGVVESTTSIWIDAKQLNGVA